MFIISDGAVSTNEERCLKILGKCLGDAASEEFLQHLLG
jgi:hypothetical protein